MYDVIPLLVLLKTNGCELWSRFYLPTKVFEWKVWLSAGQNFLVQIKPIDEGLRC